MAQLMSMHCCSSEMAACACGSMIRSGSVVARKLCPVFATQVRTSVYDKNHVEPFVDKKKLEELEASGEVEDYKFVPVKAAPSHVSTSLFYDATLDKFINMLMRKGDKALARENIELGLFNVKRIQLTKYNRATDDETKRKVECNPVTILHKALENCRPVLELSPIKRGGITYQVPVPMTENRARFLSMKWMIDAVNDKDPKVAFCDQLAKELLDAYNNQGRVVKKKHELHKQCEANKAYAHYRWS